jgi:hypothetical protein
LFSIFRFFLINYWFVWSSVWELINSFFSFFPRELSWSICRREYQKVQMQRRIPLLIQQSQWVCCGTCWRF